VESRGGVAVGRAHTVNHHVQYASSLAPVSLPYRTGHVPRLADHFHHRGIGAPLVAEDAGWTRILVGAAGVGKSQLAAWAAESLWERGKLDLLVWVEGDSREAIEGAYARAAQDVLGRAFPDPAEGARALLNWLRPIGGTTGKRWLIVVDGVADPADLADAPGAGGVWLWPPASPVGRVLITSQRRDFAPAAGRHIITVPPFSPPEARDYLNRVLEHHGRTEPSEDVAALSDRLGGLPHALSHAAHHLVSRGLTVETYLAGLFEDDAHESTAYEPLWLSVETANQMDPAGAARWVLHLVAVLAPEGAPLAVLTSPRALALITRFREIMDDEDSASLTADQVEAAVGALHLLHLVDRPDPPGPQVVRVQAPVRNLILDSLPSGLRDLLVVAAADALAQTWPQIEPGAAFARLLRVDADALIASDRGALHRRGIHPVVVRAGRSAGEWGQVAQAAAYFHDLAATAGEHLGPDHPDVLNAQVSAANWRAASGKINDAVEALTELMERQHETLADDHPDVLTTRHALIRWRKETNDDAEAAWAALIGVLADRNRVLGPDARETLETRALLASYELDLNPSSVDAAALLADHERVLGPDHPATAAAHQLVAQRHWALNDREGAFTALADSLAAVERVLGTEHPLHLSARQWELHYRLACEEGESVVTGLDALLADRERLLGPDHPDTLATRGELADHLRESDDEAGALEAWNAVYTDAQRIFGTEFPATLIALDRVAWCRADCGDVVGAVVAFAELGARRTRVLGPDHRDTLDTRVDLARWRGDAGDHIGAVIALAELLPDLTRIMGPDHDMTLAARHTLAHFRGEAGDPAGAVAEFTAVLASFERLFGSDDERCTNTRHSLAHWQKQLTAQHPKKKPPK
jgi:Tetratricopeptide repeat